MAFRGTFPAAELKPSTYGILSVARVVDHTASPNEERWVRGYAFEYDSEPTVRLLEETGNSVHTIFDASGLDQYIDVKPFFIEVEDSRSTFGLTGEDRLALVLKQLEAATQKAVERELWNGYVARDDGTTSQENIRTLPAIPLQLQYQPGAQLLFLKARWRRHLPVSKALFMCLETLQFRQCQMARLFE
jgi:hypothetical protein